jgi:nicotinate-nucleotide pyrophosphorylase (carboxylating)
MSVHPLIVDDIVRRALLEDLGRGHDVTSESVVPSAKRAKADMNARETGVLAGVDVAVTVFRLVDPALKVTAHAGDGDAIHAGQAILTIEGAARSVLTAERTALNFISHLSGIATRTAEYVAAVKGTKASIVCTRKTLPGIRALQKHAVKMGGGANHRFGLDDAVLIKDNHIALAGGIDAALKAAKTNAGHMVKIEIEVDTLEQLERVLAYKVDAVLLDNMKPDTLRQAVQIVAGRALTEASGGITLERVRAVAEAGVDLISSGALTHSVTALDIGLDIA